MSERTVIRFTHDGHWQIEEDGTYEWISENNGRQMCTSIPKAECDITYNDVINSLYRKIGVDQGSVNLRLSYIPLSLIGCKVPTYISVDDDDDVVCYLVDKENKETNRRSLLHIEIEIKTHDDEAHQIQVQPDQVQPDQIQPDDNFDVDVVTQIPPPASEEQNLAIVVVDHCRPFSPTATDVPGDQSNDFSFGDGLGFEIHQEFEDKKEVQSLILKASFKACFSYQLVTSNKKVYEIKCKCHDMGCKWSLRVAKLRNSDRFSVRTYNKVHTCSVVDIEKRKRTCTAQLVSEEVRSQYPGHLDTPTPKQIADMMKRNYGVTCSYYKAWRGKRDAAASVRGNPAECYDQIPSYLHMLKSLNPGTSVHFELDGEGRFKYLFIALGVCIQGFKALRKVIAVDGTFLKTAYKGVLIVATAQDANFHQYPLAWGIVDSENDASWTWFFTKLEELIPDNESMVIISDRNKSIIKSVAIVYKKAQHGFCAWHISQNIKALNRGKGKRNTSVVKQFMKLAGAYTLVEFNTLYEDFKNRHPNAAKYIEKSVSIQKWARCYFLGHRYNILTTNGAESINAVLKKARAYSLLPLIDAIIEKVSEWFNRHRNESANASPSQYLAPVIEKILRTRLVESAIGFEVRELNAAFQKYCVKEKGKRFTVDLEERTCTCKVFDIDKIPCVHAMAVATHHNLEGLHQYCSPYYRMELWALAYTGTVYPVPHQEEWDVPQAISEIKVFPPPVKKKREELNKIGFLLQEKSEKETRPLVKKKTFCPK